MSSKRIDNSRTETKIQMRKEHTKNGYVILDCFHGDGVLWNAVSKEKKIKIVGIEKEKNKGACSIYGVCEKVIPSLDLSKYDIIDCDAWGSPYKAIKACFDNKTLKCGTIIYYTYIQKGIGSIEKELSKTIGVTEEMYKKCKSLFRSQGFTAFKEYIRLNGVEWVTNWHYQDGGATKNYGYFVVKK
jgi:hypothetical protein